MTSLTRLNVVYLGWGESWPLGTLAQVNDRVLFEYSAQAIERGLQFSPLRVPLLSLAALVDADFRLPALDYETVLLATARITGDYRETRKAFERCVFNVLTHNRDDHAKNFAFLMDAQGRWRLSPAFDLSFSHGPGGQHSTSVAGEGARPSRADLMRVAKGGGVKEKDAKHRIDHWLNALRQPQPQLLQDLPIRQRTLNDLRKTLTEVWRGF